MGNLFTNMSLGRVAVSFTHTIKAMEPFFSVLLSALFLGEVWFVAFKYLHTSSLVRCWKWKSMWLCMLLRYIYHACLAVSQSSGCGIFVAYCRRCGTSVSYWSIFQLVSCLFWFFFLDKVSLGANALVLFIFWQFCRAGFLSAMASNVTFQSRNVLSKKLMVKKEVLYHVILFLWCPFSIYLILIAHALRFRHIFRSDCPFDIVDLSPSAKEGKHITGHHKFLTILVASWILWEVHTWYI